MGVEYNVYLTLLAGIVFELAGGNIYTFGTYSQQVKGRLFAGDPHAQTKIQALALASNIGCYLPISGFWYDSKFGRPQSTVLIGAVFTFAGYFCLYLGMTGTAMPYWLLLAACGLWGHGSGYWDVTAMTTNIKNFPNHTVV